MLKISIDFTPKTKFFILRKTNEITKTHFDFALLSKLAFESLVYSKKLTVLKNVKKVKLAPVLTKKKSLKKFSSVPVCKRLINELLTYFSFNLFKENSPQGKKVISSEIQK